MPLSTTTFADRLCEAARRKKSVLCVGLDPQLRYMPEPLVRQVAERGGGGSSVVATLFRIFNEQIIDLIAPHAIAVKPQISFYEAYGSHGLAAFEDTITYARARDLLVVTDAKRGDGGDTADTYADGHIGEVPYLGRGDPMTFELAASSIRTDALTVHGYIGEDCVGRFVRRVTQYGTGIFVVDKTSFKPNSKVEQLETKAGLKVWQELAMMVDEWGTGSEGQSGYRNVGVVLGATYPKDAPWMRQTLPRSWFLVPGYGGQGATADEAVAAANEDGLGCLVNNGRALTYAYQREGFKRDPKFFAEAARDATIAARDELNDALKKAGKLAF